MLNEYNITVIEAVNGQDAINKLVDENYDCILMDVQMPVMDGYEATRRIREYINKDIPIIGMSANAFAEDVDKGISLGMNDYLSKPFNVTDVVNSITKCLK